MLISSSRSTVSCARRTKLAQRGFTLIELLIVVTIMVIITALLLFRQQQFDSSILLRSLAYDAALSIRQVQTYGVSVRQSSPGSANFASAYGVYFSSGTPTSYILFADSNGNGRYDAGDAIIQRFTLAPGYIIANLCAGSQCATNSAMTSLTIMFSRPNPEACFMTNLDSGVCMPGEYSTASVQFSSQGGSTRSVSVSSTGEIAIGSVGS